MIQSSECFVFLAHNSADKPEVRAIAKELKKRGLNPWLDEEQIQPGDSIPRKVQEGLSQSQVSIFFIGTSGFGKFQEIWELDALIMLCYKKGMRIIPILLPGVNIYPKELVLLEARKYLQFHQSINETEPLNELFQVIKAEADLNERERGFERAIVILRDFLADGKWEKANSMTTAVMCLATGRGKEGWLRTEDINNFPCEDLHKINQLWLDYSNGKFGFSVQKEIYQQVGGTRDFDGNAWGQFCERVGWVGHRSILFGMLGNESFLAHSSNITFNINAPIGHLPFLLHITWHIGSWRAKHGWKTWFYVPNEEEQKTINSEQLWLLGLLLFRADICKLSDTTLKNEIDDLSSESGVDYTKLRDLLKVGKWKEADEETSDVMLKVAGREEEGWLDSESVKQFPCKDLRTIDNLWVKYSYGQFGFSVQKRIWQSLGGKPNQCKFFKQFIERIGWLETEKKMLGLQKELNWVKYDELDFTPNILQFGQLPWQANLRLRLGISLLSREDL